MNIQISNEALEKIKLCVSIMGESDQKDAKVSELISQIILKANQGVIIETIEEIVPKDLLLQHLSRDPKQLKKLLKSIRLVPTRKKRKVEQSIKVSAEN